MGYNKKILSQATADLNKAKAPAKPKDIIVDPRGQWEHPGQPTRIPGNNITMQGVPYPVYGIDNTGFAQMMYPGQDYQFQGEYVDEYPMLKKGGEKKYSRSITATNKLFKKNPLVKKKKTKNKKTFDPNAKYYQEGGTPYNISGPVSEQDEIQEYTPVLKPKAYGHEPEDYSQFQNFAQTLPSNLQDPGYQYGNPDQYDMYSMWSTVGKPASFADVQDTDYFPLQDDGTYHGFSVGDDGTLLKPINHGTTWMEVMNSQLNTDPYFRENALIQNEQGRLQYVPRKQYGGDISIPELTKAQEGLSANECPPGHAPLPNGQCAPIDKTVDYEEVAVYKPEVKEVQLKLIDQLAQAKKAYQDWREEAGLRKARLRNEGASSIEGLSRQIEAYKKELAEEKKAYTKAQAALKSLQKHRPDEWKNAKLKDVLSPKGVEALRSLYSEEKISDQSFRDFYNSFGKEYDTNVVEGRGPGAQYSGKEAERNWMENVPEFVSMVNKVAMAAPLLGAAGAIGPSAVQLIESAGASPFVQAARTSWRNPLLKSLPGSSARNLLASTYVADTLMDTPEVINSVRQGTTGEKNWSDVAADVGQYSFDLVTSGATTNIGAGIKSLKPEAKAIAKFLDRPISTYNAIQKPLNYADDFLKNSLRYKSGLESINNVYNKVLSKYPTWMGKPRELSKITPADLLKLHTVSTTLLKTPETYNKTAEDIRIMNDPNATAEEKLLATGRAGRNTFMTVLSLSPLLSKTAPLYSKRFADRAFFADNLLKGVLTGDPTSARALLNASRILTRQEGGSTNGYEATLSKKEIEKLQQQGYKIEYLD